jgi:hypothetical protein
MPVRRVIPGEEVDATRHAFSSEREALGKLEKASVYELFETCGCERVFVTPRSASRKGDQRRRYRRAAVRMDRELRRRMHGCGPFVPTFPSAKEEASGESSPLPQWYRADAGFNWSPIAGKSAVTSVLFPIRPAFRYEHGTPLGRRPRTSGS